MFSNFFSGYFCVLRLNPNAGARKHRATLLSRGSKVIGRGYAMTESAGLMASEERRAKKYKERNLVKMCAKYISTLHSDERRLAHHIKTGEGVFGHSQRRTGITATA